MVYIFDLDDTLYEEITFVKSGFKSVAVYLNKMYKLPEKKIFREMLDELALNGRGAVFNSVLERHSLYSKSLVNKCLSVYRLHTPEIELYPDARRILKKLKNDPVYIVTDGNKNVQNNKIVALGLEKVVKKYFLSRSFGIKNEKPSPYCFEKICRLEKIKPSEAVYIADNPRKDFVGIKPLGFNTIRVMRGNYRDLTLAEEFEAASRVMTLDELVIAD